MNSPFDEIDEEDAKPPKYYQPKHYGGGVQRNPNYFGIGFAIALGVIAAFVLVFIVLGALGGIAASK